jgi:hypothetical protein
MNAFWCGVESAAEAQCCMPSYPPIWRTLRDGREAVRKFFAQLSIIQNKVGSSLCCENLILSALILQNRRDYHKSSIPHLKTTLKYSLR